MASVWPMMFWRKNSPCASVSTSRVKLESRIPSNFSPKLLIIGFVEPSPTLALAALWWVLPAPLRMPNQRRAHLPTPSTPITATTLGVFVVSGTWRLIVILRRLGQIVSWSLP